MNTSKFSLIFTFCITLFSFSFAWSQTPGLSYQAVITDTENAPLVNTDLNFRFTINDGNNTPLFTELISLSTDAYGMVSTSIGTDPSSAANFSSLIWDGTAKSLAIEVDFLDNNGYVPLDEQHILYLPATGLQGEKGDKGDPGADGEDGVGISTTTNNDDGTITFTFTDTSTHRTDVLTGAKGDKGDTGPAGPAGPAGADGIQGIQGIQGPQGPQGPQGNPGTAGADGEDGVGISTTTNNDDGTITFTFTDTSTHRTDVLTGAKGDKGDTGDTGPAGPAGADGAQGEAGNGISETAENNDGTLTFTFDNGDTFTTSNLTTAKTITDDMIFDGLEDVDVANDNFYYVSMVVNGDWLVTRYDKANINLERVATVDNNAGQTTQPNTLAICSGLNYQ